jgi:hypothetical protein
MSPTITANSSVLSSLPYSTELSQTIRAYGSILGVQLTLSVLYNTA